MPTYRKSADAAQLALRMMQDGIHTRLSDKSILWALVDSSPTKESGCGHYGRIKVLGDEARWLVALGTDGAPAGPMRADALIALFEPVWNVANGPTRLGIVDHFLEHLWDKEDGAGDATGQLRVAPHDAEEFVSVRARRGDWSPELLRYARTPPAAQPGLFDEDAHVGVTRRWGPAELRPHMPSCETGESCWYRVESTHDGAGGATVWADHVSWGLLDEAGALLDDVVLAAYERHRGDLQQVVRALEAGAPEATIIEHQPRALPAGLVSQAEMEGAFGFELDVVAQHAAVEAHQELHGEAGMEFSLCPEPECVSARSLLRAAHPQPDWAFPIDPCPSCGTFEPNWAPVLDDQGNMTGMYVCGGHDEAQCGWITDGTPPPDDAEAHALLVEAVQPKRRRSRKAAPPEAAPATDAELADDAPLRAAEVDPDEAAAAEERLRRRTSDS